MAQQPFYELYTVVLHAELLIVVDRRVLVVDVGVMMIVDNRRNNMDLSCLRGYRWPPNLL